MANISEKEKKLLKTLANSGGTLTQSEISVKTLMLPDEIEESLEQLKDTGYIDKLDLNKGLEQEACTLTKKGRRVLKSEEDHAPGPV